ncbi:thioesterase [Oleiphilus sp. HI0009]|nr:thioesterase [Oleiphilus sp. HI0009]KZY63390.1 thioesterase [Oleiphilus sp. HI0066]KZY69294.1 thioesterase [Oleiphilus sp. HI0067]
MAVEEKIDFVKRSGLKLIEAEDGYVTCLMPAKGNQNHIGAMYAGALFTLAEIPGGALWFANFDITKCYPILKSFTIDYLKPALGDIQIRIGLSSEDIEAYQAQCMDNEKVEFELVGGLTDSQGQVVARSKGIYQLRRH